METRRDVDGQRHGLAPWLESTEGRWVGHSPPRARQRLCRLQHYYGLEDILPEEEFKKAMETYRKVGADDGREWYFPEAIWEEIMRKTLFQDLLCWRRVCKRWNLAVVTSEWTSDENKHSQTTVPLIMRWRESAAADFSLLALKPDYQEWFRMDVGHALTYLHLYCGDGRQCLPGFRCTTIASIGLLILSCSCRVHRNSHLSLVICNPLTMQVKPLKLPQLPAEYMVHSEGYFEFRLAGVIEGASDKHYKLLFSTVCPKLAQSFRVYCVYDSKNSSWKFGRGPVQSLPFRFSKATCGGCFYFLYVRNIREQRDIVNIECIRDPLTLVELCMGKYDSETDTWGDIAWLPTYESAKINLPQLAQCGGKIMFLVRRRCRLLQTGAFYRTWIFYKLDESASSVSKLWKYVQEYGSMPYPLACSSTSNSQYSGSDTRQGTRCEGQGEKVFFYNVQPCREHPVDPVPSSSSESTGLPMPVGMTDGGVLLFDSKTREWLSLPNYYPFQKADKSSVYKLEFFRPSLMEP